MLQVCLLGVLYIGSLFVVAGTMFGKYQGVTAPAGIRIWGEGWKCTQRSGGNSHEGKGSRDCLAASPAICHQALCSLSPAGVRDARSLAAAFNTRLHGRTVCCGNVKGWDASEALSARAMLSVSCLAYSSNHLDPG